MTFWHGTLFGIFGTISVEAIGIVTAAVIANSRQRKAFGKLPKNTPPRPGEHLKGL